MDDYFPVIDETINPCAGCQAYEAPHGCKSNGGCGRHTKADRIRAMTDEELAEFFGTLPCCPPGEDLEELCFPLDSCEGTDFMVKCWLKWLRQEATP